MAQLSPSLLSYICVEHWTSHFSSYIGNGLSLSYFSSYIGTKRLTSSFHHTLAPNTRHLTFHHILKANSHHTFHHILTNSTFTNRLIFLIKASLTTRFFFGVSWKWQDFSKTKSRILDPMIPNIHNALNYNRFIHSKDWLPRLFEDLVVSKMKVKVLKKTTKYQIGVIIQCIDNKKFFDKENLRDALNALYSAGA